MCNDCVSSCGHGLHACVVDAPPVFIGDPGEPTDSPKAPGYLLLPFLFPECLSLLWPSVSDLFLFHPAWQLSSLAGSSVASYSGYWSLRAFWDHLPPGTARLLRAYLWFLSTNVLSPWSLKTCSLNVHTCPLLSSISGQPWHSSCQSFGFRAFCVWCSGDHFSFSFWDRVFLCSPVCYRTCFVN